MLKEIKKKIDAEIETLTRELNVELPDRIQKAVELGDLRENAEYKSALERQQFVQARLRHLAQRVQDLSKIKMDNMSYDRAGFGSKIEVLNVEAKEVSTFTIVAGDYMDLEAGHISLDSPIGRGLTGTKEGDEVLIKLPAGERKFRVQKLLTLPQQLASE